MKVKIFGHYSPDALQTQITEWLAACNISEADIYHIKQSYGGGDYTIISIWYRKPGVAGKKINSLQGEKE